MAFACARTVPVEPPATTPVSSSAPGDLLPASSSGDAGREAVAATHDSGSPTIRTPTPTPDAWSPPLPVDIDGPHQDLSLDVGRPIYYAMPRARSGARPLRLVGHLHGMCGPPPYACGKWIGAGTDVGAMVCPTGNARCGDSPVGPASWEAPSWTELVAIMDKDLTTSVAKVEAKRPGMIAKEGAVLTGYSRGAYACPLVARMHPGRWPYLVLIEANVPLSASSLRSAGVRAVALVAGEQGTEIAGMQKTQGDLERDGFPARLFVMRRTGHLYSDDMERVMHDALAFVLETTLP